jgi:hypothetical protein
MSPPLSQTPDPGGGSKVRLSAPPSISINDHQKPVTDTLCIRLRMAKWPTLVRELAGTTPPVPCPLLRQFSGGYASLSGGENLCYFIYNKCAPSAHFCALRPVMWPKHTNMEALCAHVTCLMAQGRLQSLVGGEPPETPTCRESHTMLVDCNGRCVSTEA